MTDTPKASWRAGSPLRIGAFLADPAANELHRDGRTERVRPLLMDVLLRLAAAPGAVVTRDQLIGDVWPRRMVNDEVLSRAVAELRTLLGDDAKQPAYIETLPKVGYRLIAAVAAVTAAAGGPVDGVGARDPTAKSASTPGVPAAMVAPGRASVARTAGSAAGDTTQLAAAPAAPAVAAAALVATPAPPRATAGRNWVPAGLAALCAGLAVLAWVAFRPQPETAAALAMQLGGAQSFTSDADYELAPRFSPDGRQVIYAQGRGRETRLVIRDVAGTVVATIVKPDVLMLSPMFLRDRERIVYWQRAGGACAIVERHLASGAEREIVGCAQSPQPPFDVSPDGTHLAVSLRHRDQHPFGIARIALADGKIDMWTTPQPGEGDDARPRFSPDGSRLVFSRGTSSHGKLWLLDVARPRDARPLLALEGLDYGVAWLGRDGPLLVAADWSGFRALHRVNLTGGEAELLGARGARFPDASPNGDVVFESAMYRADLWLTGADNPGAESQVLWPSSRYTSQPVFAPDGRQVAFISNREGAESLYVGVLGGALKRLTLSGEHRHIRPHWSPDGAAVYVSRSPVGARQSGPREAVRVDVATGSAQVLTELGREVADVTPLPDGSLLVGEATANAMRLGRFKDGKMDRLPLPLVSEFQASGDDLVFLQPDLDVLTRCRLSTLQCAPLPVIITEDDRYHWHLGNGVLWYRGRPAAGAQQLLRLDLAGGTIRAFDYPPTGGGTSLASSADGRQLIVTRAAPTVVDLMLAPKLVR
ncbi:MAG: PD40 domain-containing protein [Betaproteobacteria bacterium]|nr:PD40 domain-containing protein [Betaproteobacteria bacterium]